MECIKLQTEISANNKKIQPFFASLTFGSVFTFLSKPGAFGAFSLAAGSFIIANTQLVYGITNDYCRSGINNALRDSCELLSFSAGASVAGAALLGVGVLANKLELLSKLQQQHASSSLKLKPE